MDGNTVADLNEFAENLLSGNDPEIYSIDSWQPPSDVIKEKFNSWRNRSFKQEEVARESLSNSENEYKRLDNIIIDLYEQQDAELSKGNQNDAYYSFAVMLGKIDFLLSLDFTPIDNGDFQTLTVESLALYCYFTDTNVTPNNLNTLSELFGRKVKVTLYQKYLKVQDLSNRMNTALSQHHAKRELLKRYHSILPILEIRHKDAFLNALKEFQTLKIAYGKEYQKLILPSKY